MSEQCAGTLLQGVTTCGWTQPGGPSWPQLDPEGRDSLSCWKPPADKAPLSECSVGMGAERAVSRISQAHGIHPEALRKLFLFQDIGGWMGLASWRVPPHLVRPLWSCQGKASTMAFLDHWTWSERSAWAPASTLPAAMATGACARLGARATLMLVA